MKYNGETNPKIYVLSIAGKPSQLNERPHQQISTDGSTAQTIKLPPHIEADLDKLGVRKPQNPIPPAKPADHVPWTPQYDGQEPPF